MNRTLVELVYLASASLFILGLRGLAHPKTAVRGNLLGSAGMLLAIVVTLLDRGIVGYDIIVAGVLVGSLAGVLLALRIRMAAMPQLVGLFNGLGGGASLLVAGSVLLEALLLRQATSLFSSLATVASGLIGALTFWGSLVAFGKLQGIISEKALHYRGAQVIKGLLFAVSVFFALMLVRDPTMTRYYWYLIASSSVLGVLLTVSIGGADMPVVIALLNAYSGLAAAATGFVLSNSVLIISGSLVGASGIILTRIMCRAMNRSLANVLFGGIGGQQQEAPADDIYAGKVKATSAEEVALLLGTARRVVFVPGYGMAVARAQHLVRVLYQLLEQRGVEVEFGIHPVAGRMPGHMNVLLAEENIPYEKIRALEQINPTFEQTDLTMVIGANDVVNPLARSQSGSPLSGMPILDVDKSRAVVVIKRSLSPGFAGVPNPLFGAENTLMLFGDGQKAVQELIDAYREA